MVTAPTARRPNTAATMRPGRDLEMRMAILMANDRAMVLLRGQLADVLGSDPPGWWAWPAGRRSYWQSTATACSRRKGRTVLTRTAIAADRLTKRFGPVTPVRDLTLEVHPGEVVGFLGPNGAGTTTTIRLLLGFLRPTAGRCRGARGLADRPGIPAPRRRLPAGQSLRISVTT